MKIGICAFSATLMLLLNGCGTEHQKNDEAKVIPQLKNKLADTHSSTDLKNKARAKLNCKMIKVLLHPLPHELELSGKTHCVSPQACSLEIGSLSIQELLFVEDFKARWMKRFGAELEAGKAGKLHIVAGIVKKNKSLQEAGKKGVLDLKRLADRPNPEQAYSIVTNQSNGNLNVYLAANESSGLYYALRMFEQLVLASSRKQEVAVPEVRIIDWPDIKARGLWGGVGRKFAFEGDSELSEFGGLTLNEVNFALYPTISRDMSFRLGVDNSRFERGRRHNVNIVPRVSHMEHLLKRPGLFFGDFPELRAKGKDGGGMNRFWCYAHPNSQLLLDRFYEGIARKVESNQFCIWPTESRPPNGEGPCFCPACKGDARAYFTNEIKHIIHAWRKAQAIRPSLKLTLITSQGTYPYNDDILKLIPKEVRIDLYGGSGPGNTYINEINKQLLAGYPVAKWRQQGYRIGVVPIFALSCDGAARAMLFPFMTPSLVKMRMMEFVDKGLEAVMAWLPFDSFNTAAMAEFAWNAHGRTPEEFAVSWAAQKRLKSPALAGKIICMLERPAVALSMNMRARTMIRCVQSLAFRMNGQKAPWSPRYDMLRGFEARIQLDGSGRTVHEEVVHMLKTCHDAIKLCRKVDDEELTTGALLLTQWITVIENYTAFLKHQQDPKLAKKFKADISPLIAELPKRWETWIATLDLNKRLLKASRLDFAKVMKEFNQQTDAGEKELVTE